MAKVLLKDIAKKAGMSINTVSRALKDKDDISQPTKDFINKLASEMGYIPDYVAQSLRNGYTKTIGVVFDNIANPYFMIMTETIHKVLSEENFDVMIFTGYDDRAQLDLTALSRLVSRRIDGIITFLKPTESVALYAKKNGIPIVTVGRESDDLEIDSVFTNDLHGGYLVGEHLIDKGYKNISYIGVPSDIKCSTKRLEGLEKSYKQHGLTIDEDNVKFLNHRTDDIHELVKEVVKNQVSAIFCFNDVMAYEAISTIEDLGLKVPEDIAVVGYDDIEYRLSIPTKLTTVHNGNEAITRKAVSFLLNRIKNIDLPVQVHIFEPELIIRKTT
ncbi:LacI family transcriptional regulator [Mycoplasmatota bacterium]|nr:LacI family transcriptional regulator [Mycoplasmatota bacterium]